MKEHANLPSYTSVERLIQQTTVVRQWLHKQLGKVIIYFGTQFFPQIAAFYYWKHEILFPLLHIVICVATDQECIFLQISNSLWNVHYLIFDSFQ